MARRGQGGAANRDPRRLLGGLGGLQGLEAGAVPKNASGEHSFPTSVPVPTGRRREFKREAAFLCKMQALPRRRRGARVTVCHLAVHVSL